MNDGGDAGSFFIVACDDGEGAKVATLNGGGGGGAGFFFLVGWDDDEEGVTPLNGGGVADTFFAVGWDEGEGADAGGLWPLPSWISNSGLRSLWIIFIQGVGFNLINVIRQPSRWY